jgi:hypothetical protein
MIYYFDMSDDDILVFFFLRMNNDSFVYDPTRTDLTRFVSLRYFPLLDDLSPKNRRAGGQWEPVFLIHDFTTRRPTNCR